MLINKKKKLLLLFIYAHPKLICELRYVYKNIHKDVFIDGYK